MLNVRCFSLPLLFPILLVLPIFLFSPSAVSAQLVKIGTIAPEGSPWHEGLLQLADEWRTITDGRVRLRIYGGGIAGDEPDMIRKMRIGQLNAAALTTPGLITITPDIEAISFPTLVRTDEELDYVIENLGPYFENKLEEKGFKVLTWTSTGWVHFFAKDPVVTPEDLQKQKLFFWGSDTVYVDFLKALRMQPIPLAVTDMLPSLQTGLIDAFAVPPAAALAFQWFGLAKNMTAMPWQPMPGTVVISTKTLRKIPEKYHEEMMAAARKIGIDLLKRSRELEGDAIRVMESHGLKVHAVPPDVTDRWRTGMYEVGKPVFVGKRIPAESFELVENALKEFREGRESAETQP